MIRGSNNVAVKKSGPEVVGENDDIIWAEKETTSDGRASKSDTIDTVVASDYSLSHPTESRQV